MALSISGVASVNDTQQLSLAILLSSLSLESEELRSSFSRRRRPMDSSSHSTRCLSPAMVARASLEVACSPPRVEGATPQSSL
jgi:hypothetical protein